MDSYTCISQEYWLKYILQLDGQLITVLTARQFLIIKTAWQLVQL